MKGNGRIGQIKYIGSSVRPFRDGLQAFTLALVALTTPMVSAAETDPRPPSPPGCEDGRLRVIGQLAERWLEPLASACSTVAAMPDSDRNARVRITPVEGDLKVEVTLRDGRATTRLVRETTALLPTLEALLTLPLPPPPDPLLAGTTAAEAEPPPRHQTGDDAGREDNQETRPRTTVEVGGGGGFRVAGPGTYLSIAPSIFAQAHAGGWMVGLGMRYETLLKFTGAAPEGFEADALALALTVARRIPARFGRVDVGVSPRLVTQSQAFLEGHDEVSGTSTDIRPALFARVAFGHGSPKLFVEADAEVSPTHLRREIRILPVTPPLPAWTAGVSVGAVWGPP